MRSKTQRMWLLVLLRGRILEDAGLILLVLLSLNSFSAHESRECVCGGCICMCGRFGRAVGFGRAINTLPFSVFGRLWRTIGTSATGSGMFLRVLQY